MKEIQVAANEGPPPFFFPREDDYKIIKHIKEMLKIYLFRSTGPITAKFGTNHPWVKGIQVCSNEEPIYSQKVDNGFFIFS